LLVYFNLDQLFDLANPDPLGLGLDYPITYYAQNVEGSLRNDISLVGLLVVPLFLNFFNPLRHYGLFSVYLLLQWLDLLVHYSCLGLQDLFEG
jgi:hypothetical protein